MKKSTPFIVAFIFIILIFGSGIYYFKSIATKVSQGEELIEPSEDQTSRSMSRSIPQIYISQIPDGLITEPKLSTGVQTKLNAGDATALRGKDLDESLSTPSDGEILVFRDLGDDWILETKPIGGNPVLNDVTDVTITGVTDNEILAYDNGTGDWINQTAAEAVLEPADATILKQADVDDTPVNGATNVPPSSNWAFDHENLATAHHTNANDPTAGQKAALAGTDGTPGAGNPYVTNSDSRLSDARTPTSHNNTYHSETYITSTGVTYENLSANADIGTGSTQVSQGDHNHSGVYLAEQTIGIADDNLLEVDGSPNSAEYARFTANGLEGRIESEFKSDFNLEIGTDVLAQQTIGIADNNLVEVDAADIADDEYARFTANGLESRATSEVLSDIGAEGDLVNEAGLYAALSDVSEFYETSDDLFVTNTGGDVMAPKLTISDSATVAPMLIQARSSGPSAPVTGDMYMDDGSNHASGNHGWMWWDGDSWEPIGGTAAGGGAPTDATYITQTTNGTLSAEQALGALATGIVKNTTTTGVLSIATAGTDYYSANSHVDHDQTTNFAANEHMDTSAWGGALIPDGDNTRDLGSVGGTDYRWANLYIAGNLSDETNALTVANMKTAYDQTHAAVTLAGQDYLTLSTQQVTANAIDLTDDVSGVLPVANGGSGQSSYTDGQLLIGVTAGNTLAKATITGGNGIAITNGGGTISAAVDVIDDGDAQSSTISSESGLEFVDGEIGLLRGCDNGQIPKWDETNGEWDCSDDSTGGSPTFDAIASGTNTSAEMIVGNGAAIEIEEGGEVEANEVIIYAQNETGATIPKCTAVHIHEYDIPSNLPEILIADADETTLMPAIGITYEEITNNSNGRILIGGILDSADTDTTEGWSEGDRIYVDDSGTASTADCGDNMTNVRPSNTDDKIQALGTVLRVHGVSGKLVVSGAGRSNDVPNLESAYLWVGNATNVGTAVQMSGDTTMDNTGAVTIGADTVALTTDTTGNYAAGDGEAGSATSGDSATAFFDAGTIEHERGGLEADVSAYAGLVKITGGATSAATIGIADDNILEVDGTPLATEYARFTANGLEGRTEAEFKGDFNLEIGTDVLAEQTIGIADNNLAEIDDADAADNDFAKFTANGLEGRSYAETLSDIGAEADLVNEAGLYAALSDVTQFYEVGDTIPLSDGGTGQTTAQAAIDGLTNVSAASTAEVLTKDGSGNATFQAIPEPTQAIILAASDETTAIETGTAKLTFRMPYAFTITGIRASLTTASSSGDVIIDVNEAGTSIMTTNKLLIDATEETSTTAATAATVTDTALADDAEITIDFDSVGTGATGAKISLIGYRIAP